MHPVCVKLVPGSLPEQVGLQEEIRERPLLTQVRLENDY